MKKKNLSWGLTLGVAALVAQGAQAQGSGLVLEEVVVFGSLVQRADYQSPSPVFTIDREAILSEGSPSLSAYLNQSPQFSPAFDRTSNNPGAGRGEVNLRGLGSQRTLVMLNGKRLGPAGSDGTVDVNVIPAMLVESVEVLTGGASAVYGSDAVSGVMNVNLLRDIEGLQVGGSYDVTAEEDGDTWDVSIAGGLALADGRVHLSGYYARTERDAIATAARDFSAEPLAEDFATGILEVQGSPVNPGGWIPIPAVIDGDFAADGITFSADGLARPIDFGDDGYNYYGEFNYLQTPLERDSAGLFTSFDLTERLSGYVDVIYTGSETDAEIAPIPAFTFALINLDNPFLTEQARGVLASNYDPGGSGFAAVPFGIRLQQNGPRTTFYDRENIHASLGLGGDINERWTWEASYTYTEHEADIRRGNTIFASRFEQSFQVDPATGECFDPSNGCVGGNYYGPGKLTPELLGFLRGPDLADAEKTEQDILQLILRGEIDLPNDQVASLAVGAEYREDSASYRVDPAVRSGDILASGGVITDAGGSYDVSEIYLEAVVPLLADRPFVEALTADLGLRYADYSSVGGAESWKAGLTWEIGGGLMLRAMGQLAVRAPNVRELYAAEVSTLSSEVLYGGAGADPCSAGEDPVGSGIGDICVAQGLSPDQLGIYEATQFYPRQQVTGGNTELEAEEADTVTLGLTWQPEAIEGLSLALDYYDIQIENAISQLGASELVASCFEVGDPQSEFCNAIQRDETGNVGFIREVPLNAAELTSKGFDLQLEYRTDLPPVGDWPSSLSLRFVGNKSTEYGFRADPASSFLECQGLYGLPCNFVSEGSNPEHRVNTTVSWRLGSVQVSALWRWIDEMENAGPLDAFLGDAMLVEGVDSQQYLDLNFTVDIGDDIMFFGGIRNVTDETPPLLGFNAQQSNTNPNLYDVLGRRYRLGVQLRL